MLQDSSDAGDKLSDFSDQGSWSLRSKSLEGRFCTLLGGSRSFKVELTLEQFVKVELNCHNHRARRLRTEQSKKLNFTVVSL